MSETALSVEQRVLDALRGYVRLRVGWRGSRLGRDGDDLFECIVKCDEYHRLWAPEAHPEKDGWIVKRA